MTCIPFYTVCFNAVRHLHIDMCHYTDLVYHLIFQISHRRFGTLPVQQHRPTWWTHSSTCLSDNTFYRRIQVWNTVHTWLCIVVTFNVRMRSAFRWHHCRSVSQTTFSLRQLFQFAVSLRYAPEQWMRRAWWTMYLQRLHCCEWNDSVSFEAEINARVISPTAGGIEGGNCWSCSATGSPFWYSSFALTSVCFEICNCWSAPGTFLIYCTRGILYGCISVLHRWSSDQAYLSMSKYLDIGSSFIAMTDRQSCSEVEHSPHHGFLRDHVFLEALDAWSDVVLLIVFNSCICQAEVVWWTSAFWHQKIGLAHPESLQYLLKLHFVLKQICKYD